METSSQERVGGVAGRKSARFLINAAGIRSSHAGDGKQKTPLVHESHRKLCDTGADNLLRMVCGCGCARWRRTGALPIWKADDDAREEKVNSQRINGFARHWLSLTNLRKKLARRSRVQLHPSDAVRGAWTHECSPGFASRRLTELTRRLIVRCRYFPRVLQRHINTGRLGAILKHTKPVRLRRNAKAGKSCLSS